MKEFRSFPKTALATTLIACASLLAGCGGGGESATTAAASVSTPSGSSGTSNSASTSTSVSNGALSISGTPTPSVSAGTAYSFKPTVSGGASYAFSISNKPSWATFDTTSGTLSGTPTASDLGDYNAIVISVADGASSASLTAFRISVGASKTGSATLSWTPPTTNTDSSTITNLGGYNIYYGSDATAMTNKIQITNPGLTSYTITGLDSGTHYFGITAYTTNGVESDLSGVGSASIM